MGFKHGDVTNGVPSFSWGVFLRLSRQ